MRRPPDFRYFAAVSKKADDHLTEDLVRVLDGREPQNSDVAYAYDLYCVEDHRAALDAFTLAQATPEMICSVFEIPRSVIATYQHLFFEMRAFRNKLERISFADEYPIERFVSLMRSALEAGVDYLRWTYNCAPTELSPRSIIRKAMTDTYYRSLAHRGNHLASETSREALKWFSSAARNATLMEEVEPQAQARAVEQLKIALQKDNSVLPATQTEVTPESVLH